MDGKDGMATLVIPAWIAWYWYLLPGKFWWECKRQLLVQGSFSSLKKDKNLQYIKHAWLFSNQNLYSLPTNIYPCGLIMYVQYKCTQTNSTQKTLKMFDYDRLYSSMVLTIPVGVVILFISYWFNKLLKID